jgi:DNA-binding transcriptional ArsR family regulator
MNTEVLIDAIVRQTTVLLAQLATGSGGRAKLTNTADQVFLDLVNELKSQGMTHAVIADMFGMALRSYHKKIKRLSESESGRGKTLWTTVLEHIHEKGPLLRAELLRRFGNEDEPTLRGVLRDLVDGGLVYVSGQGEQVMYRALDAVELARSASASLQATTNMVWVAIYRFSPVPASNLQHVVPAEATLLSEAIDVLLGDGRIQCRERDGEIEYVCDHCYVPPGTPAGFEAAVFDHYQAVVTTICNKLALLGRDESSEDVGASTFRFEVWEGHPHRAEVTSLLARLRDQMRDLRQRVEGFNADNAPPEGVSEEQHIAYVGKTRLLSE